MGVIKVQKYYIYHLATNLTSVCVTRVSFPYPQPPFRHIQTMLKLSRGGLDLTFGFYAERNTSQHCLIGGRGGARMLIPGTEVKFVAVLTERNGFRG